MKEKLLNRKNNFAVGYLHKSNYYNLFFHLSNQLSKLIYKQKNPAQKMINSLYSFVFLIPKKVRLYAKPPPKLA